MSSWFEVEVKVKIDNLKSLKEKIKKIAKFKEKETKDDSYFSTQKSGYPLKAFRIRDDKQKIIVNLKKRFSKPDKSGIVVKKEFEFELSDKKHIDNFFVLIKDFGFKEWLHKRKITEKYSLNKNKKVSLEINQVENLGNYLEIEYLAEKDEIGKAKKVISETLEKLEIPKSAIDNVGYTKRLYDKKAVGKKHFLI